MDLIVEVYVMLFIITMVTHTTWSLNTEGHQDDNFAVTCHNENLDGTTSDNTFGVTTWTFQWAHIGGLAKDCRYSIANALELLQSCV